MRKRTFATLVVGGMLLFLGQGLTGSELPITPKTPDNQAHPIDQFLQAHPQSAVYESEGRPTHVYGRSFSH
ncbi:MAG: hypothetical protein ACYS0G_14875, partial [Planctomycetota bacterium]